MITWERRDFPVLHALATSENENVLHGFLDEDHAAETLGLDLSNAEIHQALHTLADADYITGGCPACRSPPERDRVAAVDGPR